jgi:hypothetical protein
MKYSVILFAALLGGCVTTGTQGDVSNVCEALGANYDANGNGAIRYNTKNNNKGRFAGKVLALDLATRNRLGISLHCPGF